MYISYFIFTLIVLGSLGALFWAIQQYLIAGLLANLSSDLKKFGGLTAILIWSITTSILLILAWIWPYLGWICYLVQVGVFVLVLFLALKKAGISVK